MKLLVVTLLAAGIFFSCDNYEVKKNEPATSQEAPAPINQNDLDLVAMVILMARVL